MTTEQHVSHEPEADSIRGGSNTARVADEVLAVAICRGSREALEQLYDRHARDCFAVAIHIVEEPLLAEEIMQDVFVKLLSRPQAFSAERGAFKTWLLAVVSNRARDERRRLNRRSAMQRLPLHSLNAESTGWDTLVDLLPDTAPTPHDQVWASETAGAVRDALSQLPGAEQQAIALAYFGGLTQREIAVRLNQPLGTVKSHTRLALRRLRSFLATQSRLSD